MANDKEKNEETSSRTTTTEETTTRQEESRGHYGDGGQEPAPDPAGHEVRTPDTKK